MSATKSVFSRLKAALSVFIASNQSKLIILGSIFLTLFFLSTLPYFNLILSKTAVFFLVWLLAVFWLRLSGKVSVVFALILLGICPFLLMFGKEHLAEEVANLVFGLLVIGVSQEFRKLLVIKKLKN